MLIKIKVFAGAKKDEIIKKSDDSFAVYLKEKAERGLANERLKEMLAVYLQVPHGRVRLKKGSRQNHKIIDIVTP